MTDKEKQIEEMRKEVAKIHRFFLENDDYESLDDYIADMLYNAGYRKIPKDSVVLTREEYDEMIDDVKIGKEKIIRIINSAEKESRKKTAREILDKVDYESSGQTKQITDLLRKQYGVILFDEKGDGE